MKIFRYVSDLHLEMLPTINYSKITPLWNFKQGINDKYYLALLGDIGNPFTPNLQDFLSLVAPKYHKIFYIPGNHEYYNLNINLHSKNEHDYKLNEICSQYDNIILLNNKSYDLDGIKIIGSTLWSNIDDKDKNHISSVMNDYHLIKKIQKGQMTNITTDDTNSWNRASIKYIEKEISNTSDPCIVLTHHAPLYSNAKLNNYTAHPIYLNSRNNPAFHNDLIKLIRKPVVAWLYGHTHHTSSFKINNVIVATNQLGYIAENPPIDFDVYAYLDLDKLEIAQMEEM